MYVPTQSPRQEEVSLRIISLHLCISLSISSLSLPFSESLSHSLIMSLVRSFSLSRVISCVPPSAPKCAPRRCRQHPAIGGELYRGSRNFVFRWTGILF
jgi:hypothetical protein